MRKNALLLIIPVVIFLSGCSNKENKDKNANVKTMNTIAKADVEKIISNLKTKFGEANVLRIERGVNQAASFWTEKDGTAQDFEKFCFDNFLGNEKDLDMLFERISTNFEVINGNYNKISLDLKRKIHLTNSGDVTPIDEIFGSFDPYSHLADDMFNNKVAFIVALNFPFYTLKEKTELGEKWSRKQWAHARVGDMFVSRVPADVLQKVSDATNGSESYIAGYNICLGYLVDNKGKTMFPKDLKLITHWGLRDEIKSQYADNKGGLEKQKMIYEAMKRIINQEIPEKVINCDSFTWNPYSNKLYKDSKEISFSNEPNTRYKNLLDNFHAMKAVDAYSPQYPNYIKRKFESEMEISQEDVEKLFVGLLESPQVKKVAELIKKRLGRNLEPYDIWYDGFKSRSTINEEELTKKVRAKYPNIKALSDDLPNILVKLGFTSEKAKFITSKIAVDPSRGAGHAWGSQMKSDVAHLRTRFTEKGMDYKAYNIAVHEFGHNVEQTTTLQDVDYYMLNGVPNTAFTEALAFNFQKRDLELLGIKDNNPNKEHLMALDNFWACYEIMGVSLVDMAVWKWLYENPEATPEQLKVKVVEIAKNIWNKYYADVFGIKDEPILAIYSHMIDAPLYLSAYPIGHLIDFQIEKQIKGKNLANEVIRMFTYGKVVPQLWMKNAVGKEISIQPMLESTDEALKNIK